MRCDFCNTATSGKYIIRRQAKAICDVCDWGKFEKRCEDSLGDSGECWYPINSRKAVYTEYAYQDLIQAAIYTRNRISELKEMKRGGFTFVGRRGPSWYTSDYMTIMAEIATRLQNDGILGKVVNLNG